MLIASDRHTDEDLRVWHDLEVYDVAIGAGAVLAKQAVAARGALAHFEPDYVGVSWGKDSVVVAHLARLVDPSIPLVWVRVHPIDNPDCVLVRDDFLAVHPGAYAEIDERVDSADEDAVRGAHRRGFARAAKQFGERYASGVRAEESAQRALSAAVHGVSTDRTCRPILRWSGLDVFGYLARYGLPVHPAYACSYGGMLDRIHLRVAAIGGKRGQGRGRREWERCYYPEMGR